MSLPLNLNYFNIVTWMERSVFGIGRSRAAYLCDLIGLSKPFFFSGIATYYKGLLERIPYNYYLVASRLQRLKQNRIQFLIDINSYRGFRAKNHLPWKGQRTCSNAKTRKRFGIY